MQLASVQGAEGTAADCMNTTQNPETATGTEVGGLKIRVREVVIRRPFDREYGITMEDIQQAMKLLEEFTVEEHPPLPKPEDAVIETVSNPRHITPLVRRSRFMKKWTLREIRGGVFELYLKARWEKTVEPEFYKIPVYDAEIGFASY